METRIIHWVLVDSPRQVNKSNKKEKRNDDSKWRTTKSYHKSSEKRWWRKWESESTYRKSSPDLSFSLLLLWFPLVRGTLLRTSHGRGSFSLWISCQLNNRTRTLVAWLERSFLPLPYNKMLYISLELKCVDNNWKGGKAYHLPHSLAHCKMCFVCPLGDFVGWTESSVPNLKIKWSHVWQANWQVRGREGSYNISWAPISYLTPKSRRINLTVLRKCGLARMEVWNPSLTLPWPLSCVTVPFLWYTLG